MLKKKVITLPVASAKLSPLQFWRSPQRDNPGFRIYPTKVMADNHRHFFHINYSYEFIDGMPLVE
jgi:hypothetical protein